MNSPLPPAFGSRQLRHLTWLMLALWTLALVASMLWNRYLLRDAMQVAAALDARNSFNKDVLYRRWATSHGGVYVPVTAATPPNPYLTNVVERDLVTPSGRRLTLVNPAYMTRQVHELGFQQYGSRGHITSLNPLRLENAPDAWEAAALRAFEKGQTEVLSHEPMHGELHLRFMKPLVTEEACLKCHAVQGYKKGEIRGGVSISVPLAPYLAVAQARIGHVAGAHAVLWGMGVLGITLGARQMRRRLEQQLQAEKEIVHQASFARFNPNPVLELSAAGEINFSNAATREMARELGLENPAQMLPANTAALVRECRATGQPKLRVETPHGPRVLSWSFFPVPFNDAVHCYAGDITARKQAEASQQEALDRLQKIASRVPGLVYQYRLRPDGSGDLPFASDAIREIYRLSPEDVREDASRIFTLIHPDDAAGVGASIQQSARALTPWQHEYRVKFDDGTIRALYGNAVPQREADGSVLWHGFITDITARKKAEAEREFLIKSLQEALASVKTLSGLVPICAHCKKIRDDQGFWSQVETYVAKHTQAKFTHGMCPECIRQYFPGVAMDQSPGTRGRPNP